MSLLHVLSYLPIVAAVAAALALVFFFAPILKACDLIDGRLWAIGVIVLVGVLVTAGLQLAVVKAERDAAKALAKSRGDQLDHLSKAVTAQKKQATDEYAALKADRDAKQSQLNDARRALEVKDENHEAAMQKAGRALRAAAAVNGGRLRDPWAVGARCGGGGDGGTAGPGAGAADRAAGETETGGLLSAELSRRLQQLQLEADTINRAYAACRPDSYRVRGLPAPADSLSSPTTERQP